MRKRCQGNYEKNAVKRKYLKKLLAMKAMKANKGKQMRAENIVILQLGRGLY